MKHYKDFHYLKSFVINRREGILTPKKYITNIDDPQFADPDSFEITIETFNAQIEKINEMIVEDNGQIKFDYPNSYILSSILRSICSSIQTQSIPKEIVFNDILILFINSLLVEFQNEETIITIIAQIDLSMSMYDFIPKMKTIVDQWPYFLQFKSDFITAKEYYILSLSNFLIDDTLREDLYSINMHEIVLELLMNSENNLFNNCLNYISNYIFFYNKNSSSNNLIFLKKIVFSLMNILNTLHSNNFIQFDQILDFYQRYNIPFIMEVLYDGLLNHELFEFSISNGLETSLLLVFKQIRLFETEDLAINKLAKSLFQIMKLILSSPYCSSFIFNDTEFFDIFYIIFKQCFNDTKIEGVILLIYLTPKYHNVIKNTILYTDILQSCSGESVVLFENESTFLIQLISNFSEVDIQNEIKKFYSLYADIFLRIIYLNNESILSLLLDFFLERLSICPEFWQDFIINSEIKDAIFEIIDDFSDGNIVLLVNNFIKYFLNE